MPFWLRVFIWFSLATALSYYQWWLPALVMALALLGGALLRPDYARKAWEGLLVFLLGLFYFTLAAPPPPPPALPAGSNTLLAGRIDSFPRRDGQTTSFVLATTRENRFQHKVQVFCYFDRELLKGASVTVRGDLEPPASPGNPGEFDYPSYLRQNGIYYVMAVKDAAALTVIAEPGGISGWMAAYRQQCQTLFQRVLPSHEAGLLLGMLLGITDGIDSQEYDDYQKTGVVHMFSVSGLHVGFLLLLCTWLCSLLGVSKTGRMVTGIGLLLVYGTLTGWSAPVSRSVVMGCLGLLAYFSGRHNQLLNALGLSGIVVLLANPCALMQLSFQLTFLATWGLVYLFPLVKKRLAYQKRLWDWVLVPVCAQVAVLPLLVYHFNLISPVSLLANILLGYLSGGAVILGFIALVLMPAASGLAAFFLYPAGFLIEIIAAVNHLLVQLPAAYFWAASPVPPVIGLYYAGLLLMVCSLVRWPGRRALKTGAAMMTLFLVVVLLPAGWFDRGVLEATFIDVGQGDSILLKTPGGKFILVDGGGSEFSQVVDRKLMPYLHHRGITRIYLLISTHPDTDHLQGLITVASTLKVQYAALPACQRSADNYRSFTRILRDRHIPWFDLSSGQKLNLEPGLKLEILYPDGDEAGENTNDRSLVMLERYGRFSLLLTGDIQQAGMEKMMSRAELETVTAVKIPHHGSKGSLEPAFYDAINPQWAVISVGAGNRFGHPHPLVVEELARRQVTIYRTDRDGAVTIRSNGKNSIIECFKKTG